MSRSSALPLCALAGALACSHAATKPLTDPAADPAAGPAKALAAQVDAARREASQLLVAQAETAWRNWVYGDPADLAKTYLGHQQLFSAATLALVGAVETGARDPGDRRALGYFRRYLVGEALGQATAEIAEALATLEAQATFAGPDGAEHPYRELERLLAGARDHRARLALGDSALPIVHQLTALLAAKEEKIQALLPSLGYANASDFGAALRGLDRRTLPQLAESFLTATEATYATAMDRQLRSELGLALVDARRADLPRFNRAPDLDGYFPADKMIGRLQATLHGLGIDLDRQPAIRIDDAPLPTKNPRAVCFDVVVPSDIRLSIKPVGGIADYQALFHEAGHAEHYAHTTSPRFEFQQLGDGAASEAYAFLFEGLLQNRLWLAEQTGLTGQKLAELVQEMAVKKLYRLRRYAGKVQFEIQAQGLSSSERRLLYQRTLARAYGFALSEGDADRYLVDGDAFFASADYLRAGFLAAQLEAKLVAEQGPRWWSSPGSGKVLIELWREGNGLTAEEVAARFDAMGLRPEPLLEQLQQQLTL